MNILSILPSFSKIIPLTKSENNKPFHAGEIYFLWEGLTAGYGLVSVAETYLMNTEESEIHFLLESLVKETYMKRINLLEKILKKEGFTVPVRPASKLLQGKPGVGQEVKLNDDEIINNLIAWGQVTLNQDAKAVGAITRESVRKVFTDLLFDNMKNYDMIMDLAINRQTFIPAPPATAKDNSLNMDEVARLWEEIHFRHISVINLTVYLSNTKDQELIKLLKRALFEVALPQLDQIETMLKKEGFTVPTRPADRLEQGPPGQVSKINLSDNEILGVLLTAAQIAIMYHVRAYSLAIRKDVKNLFRDFTSTEVEDYQKLIQLTTQRHTLDNPPVVTSRHG
ncbi:DUF3231 family protein [Pelotomaculum terephthalicicum JT]|uniref:DUF3231 family protein n=1 Tax=Pelotomaculum TaxID=191373 RepID=UPI0009CA7C1D|nr:MULTISPECIES: DUF3231 family protein [Pelotomaculum]MCG9969369.1 DUF3231 family protein [Pelotomaculum terephthalicicum JT]OPX87879.1 MAG: hypothetical protein A4E54_01463 [Pelotomaculum sp. PtaB.Bin117]